jgi:hypothetical protein
MRCSTLSSALATILATASIGMAATIHVPADQPTIQAGIDAAVDGDTVMVHPGIYYEHDIDFQGKAIRVMGTDPEDLAVVASTVVDADSMGRVFYFGSGEVLSSVLAGFTITGGYLYGDGRYGGGIICVASSPMISNNIISGNSLGRIGYVDDGLGAGISCIGNSQPIIKGNIISSNAIWGDMAKGGGVHCLNSSPIISNNIITKNSLKQDDFGAHLHGAGIYVSNSSSPVITNNVISKNIIYTGNIDHLGVDAKGGGIFCGGSGTISDNIIQYNEVEVSWREDEYALGGGIFCDEYTSPSIENNIIFKNSVLGMIPRGGGIFICESSSPYISNSIITENTASYGGGVLCGSSAAEITNSVITSNSAPYSSGMACEYSSPTITNTIIWDEFSSGGDPVITYSDIQGGYPGEGNIDEDPMFVLPEQQDYRLLWGSPCIDTGHPDSLDADGTRSDMGAHYFNQNDHLTLYITPDKLRTRPGQQFGVTYTAINRWDSPESFWVLSQVLLPGGSALNVLGPDRYTLPANHTAQVHITHPVPNAAPTGVYRYLSAMGVPPSTLYDWDSFKFMVIE